MNPHSWARRLAAPGLLWAATICAEPWPTSAERVPGQLHIQHWSRDEGLPSNAINALARTPDGYLWIGSTEGLARFDGRRFEVWDSASSPAFVSNEVRALAAGTDGTLYVMLASGALLRRAGDGSMRVLAEIAESPATAIFPLTDGSLLACRWGELLRVQADGVVHRVEGLAGNLNCRADAEGRIHVGSDGAWLNCDRQGSCRRIDLPARPQTMGNGLHVEGDSVWIWDSANLLHFDLGGRMRARMATPEALRACSELARDPEGTLWCSANAPQGLARSPSTPAEMQFVDGEIGKALAMLADGDALWVGSWGQGLYRISAPPVLTLGEEAGIVPPGVAFLHERAEGTWLVGSRERLHLLRDGRAQPLPVPQQELDRLLDVTTLPGGDLLLARVLGVDRSPFPPTRDSWHALLGTQTGEGHYVLEPMPDGSVWIGTQGLFRYRPEASVDAALAAVDPDMTTAYALVHDRQGRLHLATRDGIWRERPDGRFEREPAPAPRGRFILMAALRDSRGDLWFGGYEIGLYHHDGERWWRLTTADGLPSQTAYGIVEDAQARLWVAHGRGLYTLSLDSVRAWRREPSLPLAIRPYTRSDGLRSEIFSGGSGKPALRARDGTLWFASEAGVVRLDPARLPVPLARPAVRIESARVDGEDALREGGTLSLPAGSQELRLRLGFPAPGQAERVGVRWRSASHADWQALGDDGALSLQRLPPGEHRLEFELAVDGVWAPALTLAVAQAPYWYQRGAVQLAIALGALLGVAGLQRLRLRALRSRNLRLQKLVDERGAALVEQQQRALQAEAAQREAQRDLHYRRVASAQATWSRLDALARVVLHPLVRASPSPLTRAALVEALKEAEAGFGPFPAASIDAALQRLAGAGIVACAEDRWQLADRDIGLLPEFAEALSALALRQAPRVGAYRLLEPIGAGGHGEVWRARSIADGSEAAVKLLRADPETHRDAARRLQREGAIVARLRHPNIVRLLERGEHDGRLYLAMERVQGETLAARLQRSGALPAAQVAAIARQLAEALATLHAAGVVHRDLNPANAMIEAGGRVVLLDFGLARGTRQSALTRPQTVLGTLPYMAPEMLRGGEAGAPADLWAFGVVCAELLTGSLPWKGGNSVEMAIEVGRFASFDDYPAIADPRWRELLGLLLNNPPSARIDAPEVLRRLGTAAFA